MARAESRVSRGDRGEAWSSLAESMAGKMLLPFKHAWRIVHSAWRIEESMAGKMLLPCKFFVGKTLKRPWWTPVPSLALRVVFGGEMANQTLLTSQRVVSKWLREAGYPFLFPDVGPALEDLLG